MKTADRKTAKIYAFPPGGKRAISHKNPNARTDQPQPASLPTIEIGGCWYHDAAMAEAAEKQKH